jgi:Peptidase family M28
VQQTYEVKTICRIAQRAMHLRSSFQYSVGECAFVVFLLASVDCFRAIAISSGLGNVMGRIPGHVEPDRTVLMGVHRDAWVAGAEDPVSGLVTFLEVARNLGRLVRRGWKPRRTIVLGNWDAEEYGLIGSVEWVEKHAAELQAGAVAYVNVDMTTGGDRFLPRGCPNMNALMRTVTKQVSAPTVAYRGPTVFDSWTVDGETDRRMHKL